MQFLVCLLLLLQVRKSQERSLGIRLLVQCRLCQFTRFLPNTSLFLALITKFHHFNHGPMETQSHQQPPNSPFWLTRLSILQFVRNINMPSLNCRAPNSHKNTTLHLSVGRKGATEARYGLTNKGVALADIATRERDTSPAALKTGARGCGLIKLEKIIQLKITADLS